MRKLVHSIICIMSFAASASAQISFSPEIGVNMSYLAFGDGDYGYGYSATTYKPGLIAGTYVDIPMSQHFYLLPGLFYMMSGCDLTGEPGVTGGSININTIEIPLTIEYKFGNDGGGRFFIGSGPYVAFNISGTTTYGGQSQRLSIGNEAQDSLGNGDNIKPVDIGIRSNFGYMFPGGLYFRFSNQLGIVNLSPPSYYGTTIQSSALSFTIGYCIRGANANRTRGQYRNFYKHNY